MMAKATSGLDQLVQNSRIETVGLDRLHLDPENPRLPEHLDRADKSLLNHIASTTAIEDLVSAIATNGFFPGEPLVVVPLAGKTGHFTVVEGNRRLTALRLLQNPAQVNEPSKRLLEIVEEAKYKPSEVPVVVRPSRDDVLPYLGFRHITGVKEWDPLAKARYMKQLFDKLTKKSEAPENRYTQIAKAIGSRSNHIRRNLNALAVYQLMEGNDFFDVPDLSEDTIAFGSLYTAIGEDRIARFVGAAQPKDKTPEAASVPTHPIVFPDKLNSDNVKSLTEWLFRKNDEGETIVGESRNIKQLAAVVANNTALKALREGRRLDYAYRMTKGIDEDFAKCLWDAEGSIREAAGMVASVSFDQSMLDLARKLRDNIQLIGSTMSDKQKQRQHGDF